MFHEDDEVTTLYTFNGDKPEDLAFKRKETLTIIGPTKDANWLRARHPSGRMGLIPYNYVIKKMDEIPDVPWFHGQIDREETDILLQGKADGTFLVRESVKYKGDYTLSVISNGTTSHYLIVVSDGRYSVDSEEYFPNLKALVNHYAAVEDGLCCRLRKYVPSSHQMQLLALHNGGWSKKRSEVTLLDKIGCGEFGEVVRGHFENRDVAVKCFKKDTNPSEEKLFTYEAYVMSSLQHSNLVTFIGVTHDAEQVYLITEFMPNGSLINYLRSRGRTVVSKDEQLKFALDTCCGMTYLEQKGIVHRDLAARNVLLDSDLTAKVADFGLAQLSDNGSGGEGSVIMTAPKVKMPSTNETSGETGNRIPIKWTAPEAVRHNKFTTKSDVWSFGVLLWEIYSFGRMPYPRLLATQVLRNLEHGYRMEAPEDCPIDIYDIMKQTWQLDPTKRPSFNAVISKLRALRNASPSHNLVTVI